MEKYSSLITFISYVDYDKGVQFVEEVLQLDKVYDSDFAKVYKVNESSFLGVERGQVRKPCRGKLLLSLTTDDVEREHARVKKLEVFNLSEVRKLEEIPLKSFFFEDHEGYVFEMQQFLSEELQKIF